MNSLLRTGLAAIAFDIYWTLVVLFRERGILLWLGLALVVYFMLPPGTRRHALVIALVGCGLDTFHVLAGRIAFQGGEPVPLWMVALWLMFSCVWAVVARSRAVPPWLLVPLAATGGPLAYLLGAYLGAMNFHESVWQALAWLSTGWACLALLSCGLLHRSRV
ncbi:DUF2878 domain-containing protein [Mangrovibacter plantisponsor]|uniref:Uncharacterized protein DUF2878 n=1 Tax=Mangrovibacter plantisponsor TaxID=451513 RepID=A0A317PVK7_9ENTR|nr:DUF2878 domain-containing protein [Mangrovibacter plantisponsor]PWW06738.1 uncharacterized protein DUF2878 [Mangrovibacter plantisponsor]